MILLKQFGGCPKKPIICDLYSQFMLNAEATHFTSLDPK